MDIYRVSPHPTAHPSASVCRRNTSLWHPLTISSPVAERCPPGRHPHPSPASLWRLLCAPLRTPATVDFSCACSPPIFRPWPAPRYLLSPRGFARCGDLRLPCVYASTSLCVSLSTGILWCFVSLSGGRFRARVIGQGASTPCHLLALVFVPSLPYPVPKVHEEMFKK